MHKSLIAAVAGLTAIFTAGSVAAQSYGPCQRATGGVQMAGPFRVLFDPQSAEVRPSEKKNIDEAVQRAKDRQVAQICVIGKADKVGSAGDNYKLSQERAEAVAAELKRQGIDGKKLVIDAQGEMLERLNLGGLEGHESSRSVLIVFAR
jgi:outer membrane protein OmpA-like peptidoglycan-associated protein